MDTLKERADQLLWSVSETARQLDVCQKTVHRLIDKGAFPVVRYGRRIYLSRESILDWVKSQTRYNLGCVGSAVQGASTCHISAKTVRTGGHLSQMQTERELDALLEPPTARKRRP
ncbi:MAG TPA: DNA-binding protein [Gammaproteobacteria bacterium]|nr:DNA-binding protein [Gammaproteobacteria bacterium]